MNFSILLLIAYVMAGTTQSADSSTTGNTGTTGSSQTTADNSGTTAAATTAASTTAPAPTTPAQTTAGTTGSGPGTTAGSGTSAAAPELTNFEVKTTFTGMDDTKFNADKTKLKESFAEELGVDASKVSLSFDATTNTVTVTVTGITTDKANAAKNKVGGSSFTADLNQKIQEKGVTGVTSTGSEAMVATTQAAATTKSGGKVTTAEPTGSCGALTVFAGLLALLAY